MYLIKTLTSMNFDLSTNHIVSYLRWNLKNKNLLSLPQNLLCYTSPVVQSELRQIIYQAAQNGSTKIVEILAPLTDNPNAPDEEGRTPSSVTYNAEIRAILLNLNRFLHK